MRNILKFYRYGNTTFKKVNLTYCFIVSKIPRSTAGNRVKSKLVRLSICIDTRRNNAYGLSFSVFDKPYSSIQIIFILQCNLFVDLLPHMNNEFIYKGIQCFSCIFRMSEFLPSVLKTICQVSPGASSATIFELRRHFPI